MSAETPLAVGDAVVYEPYPGAPLEDGVVTELIAGGVLARVRYAGPATAAAKATPVRSLKRVTLPRFGGGYGEAMTTTPNDPAPETTDPQPTVDVPVETPAKDHGTVEVDAAAVDGSAAPAAE